MVWVGSTRSSQRANPRRPSSGDHRPGDLGSVWRLASGTRGGAFEPPYAARKVVIVPAIGGSLGLAGRPNDRPNAGPLRPHQDDPCPPNQLLRRVAARHPAFRRRPILGSSGVFQRRSGTPSQIERNPLKSRIKMLHWWGPDRCRSGPPTRRIMRGRIVRCWAFGICVPIAVRSRPMLLSLQS